MPVLEVLHFTGDVSRHELSKGQPVTIGSHSTNDIVIDDESVELMHCRVSWSKSGFEAVAAGVEGLDINGNVVQRAVLKDGDTLRFGSVDVRFVDADGAPVEKSQAKQQPAAKPAPPPKPAKSPPPADEDLVGSPAAGWDALEALASESKAPEKPKKRAAQPAVEAEIPEAVVSDAAELPEAEEVDDEEEETSSAPKLSNRLRSALTGPQYRPGQEDTVRSPLVLTLVGAAVLLVLLGTIFFFVAGRQDAEAAFEDAKSQYDQGKYAQAYELFGKFLEEYPGSALEDEAIKYRALSQIDVNIYSAAKKWRDGLESVREFINLRESQEDFAEDRPGIHDRLIAIATGATTDAGTQNNRDLIAVGVEAETLLTTYLSDEEKAQVTQTIANARRVSEAAIVKQETFDQAIANISAYVPIPPEEGEEPAEDAPPPRPIPALVEHRNLLASYPELSTHRVVTEAMTRILEAERGLVVYTEINSPAATDDPQAASPPALSLVFNARSRIDEVSVGQCVFALSKDAIYGIDTVTGQPVWRRVIGFSLPFYPVEEPGAPNLIVFDTNRYELCRIDRNTGELLWRQPLLGEDVRSAPIIHEGQILLPTMGGNLFQVDLLTGTLLGKLMFSQEVTSPVPLADGKLVVAGNEEVAYTLTGRPFTCVGVSYLGHKPRSVSAPLLSMGPYVAMIETIDNESSLLRLLDASGERLVPVPNGTAPIIGQVFDTPVIHGRDLFVPSTGERVTAFSISDDTNQPALTPGPTFQVQNGSDNPVFLLPRPDRQAWMSSSALSLLQLSSTALASVRSEVTVGAAAQPLQDQSGVLFNGRHRAYSTAVTLTPLDLDEQTSEWQAQVGASLLAVSSTDSTLICLTEEGAIFRITDMGWSASTFAPESTERLTLNPELAEPLRAASLGGGQIVVTCGDPEPKLWIINVRGEIERSSLLEAKLQADPVVLGSGIVLPMQGRLKYQPIRSGGAGAEDYSLPTDEALSSQWVQVVALSETSLAALTSAGDLILIALQPSPRQHLGEVSRFSMPAEVRIPLQGDDQFLVVADINHNVQVFDSVTLSPVAQRTFATGVLGVWSASGMVFVQDADYILHLVSGPNLETSVQVQLDSTPAGPPTISGTEAMIPLQDGTVFTWDLQSGNVLASNWVGAALAQSPFPFGNELIFVTLDGSLIRMPADLQVAAGDESGN